LSKSIVDDQGPGAMARVMHYKSAECHPDTAILQRSHFGGKLRRKAVMFITGCFEKAVLRDDWAVACLTLWDRMSAAREVRRLADRRDDTHSSTKSGDCISDFLVEIVAVVLIVLKQSTVEAELDNVCIRDIIFSMLRVSTSEFEREWWPRIRKAEIAIYGALDYRVCIPTPLDLATHIAIDVCKVAHPVTPASSTWPGLSEVRLPAPNEELSSPTPLFTVLATYLVELGLAHAHQDVYKHGTPPVVLSLSALNLALYAFGCEPPAAAARALETASQELLDCEKASVAFPRVASSLLALWAAPPDGSLVAAKWSRRMLNLPTALPQLPPGFGRTLQTPERKSAALPVEFSPGPKTRRTSAKCPQSQDSAKTFSAREPPTFPFSYPQPHVAPSETGMDTSRSVIPSRTIPTPKAVAPNLLACEEFEVKIRKEKNGRLGVNIEAAASNILISSVGEDGPVHEWNVNNPLQKVHPGDEIIAVNGLSSDTIAMKAECKRNCHLRLVFRRLSQAKFGSVSAEQITVSPEIQVNLALRRLGALPDSQPRLRRSTADVFQTSDTVLGLTRSSAARIASQATGAVLEETTTRYGMKRLAAPLFPEDMRSTPTPKRIRRQSTSSCLPRPHSPAFVLS